MVIAIVLLVQLLILVLDYSAPQEPPAELSRKLVDEAAEAAAQGDGTAPKRCTDFCSVTWTVSRVPMPDLWAGDATTVQQWRSGPPRRRRVR